MFIFYEYLKLSAVSLLSELNFYACAHPVVGLQCFDAVGFWYWLIQIVPEKRPLNGCVCVSTADSLDERVMMMWMQ